MASIGPPFLEMHIRPFPLVSNANMQEWPLLTGMRCPTTHFLLEGIDFMGLFHVSFGYSYILLVVDYVSKWVEDKAKKTNDAQVVVDFVKSIVFCRFGVPKAIINDQGRHFCNKTMPDLLQKYGVIHRFATT